MNLIGLIVVLIVLGLCFWAVKALAGAFGIPAPVVVVIQVFLVLIAVLYLVQVLFGVSLPGLQTPLFR